MISQNYVTSYNRKTHKALHPKKNYQLKNSTTPYQQEHPEGITSKGELLLALCLYRQPYNQPNIWQDSYNET